MLFCSDSIFSYSESKTTKKETLLSLRSGFCKLFLQSSGSVKNDGQKRHTGCRTKCRGIQGGRSGLICMSVNCKDSLSLLLL